MTDQQRLYELVDSIIKQPIYISEQVISELIQIVRSSPEQTLKLQKQPKQQQKKPNSLFDLPSNTEYILRRFINACMSTNPQIRLQSYQALYKFVHASDEFEFNQNTDPFGQYIRNNINIEKLTKFVINTSAYNKNKGNKKSQSYAYGIGRLLIVKALSQMFVNSSQIYQSILQVMQDFPQLQKQSIQILYLISNNKVLKVKFCTLLPTNQSSRFLYRILLKIKDPKSQMIKLSDYNFQEILQNQILEYPKNSVVLYNLGKYLHTVLEQNQTPLEFFRKYANKFLNNDSINAIGDKQVQNQVSIHEIYYILIILKGFLQSNTITQQNYTTHFDKKIMAVWLEQFRVLNKNMKKLAKQIKINFQQNNAELAYSILNDMHQQGVYIDNVSVNHPLAVLYQYVDVDRYWKYLYELCVNGDVKLEAQRSGDQQKKGVMIDQKNKNKKNKNKKQQKKSQKKPKTKQPIQQQQQSQQQQQQPQTYYNQLQYFIKLRFKQLSDQNICSTIILFLNIYHQNQNGSNNGNGKNQKTTNKNKQILFLCINLFNIFCKITKKRKNVVTNGASVVKKQKQSNKTYNPHKRFIKKPLLILSKIELQQLKSLTSTSVPQNKSQEQTSNTPQERLKIFKECIVWLKKNTLKLRKQDSSANTQVTDATLQMQIDFFNFYSCMLFYCLIYVQQIEVCVQLQFVYKDLMTFFTNKLNLSNLQSKSQNTSKKKQKRQKPSPNPQTQSQQPNKPIHVLNDIFISLMTKPPTFLRKSIHNLYDNIIPYLDQTDIGNMLTVITTPDVDFIQQI